MCVCVVLRANKTKIEWFLIMLSFCYNNKHCESGFPGVRIRSMLWSRIQEQRLVGRTRSPSPPSAVAAAQIRGDDVGDADDQARTTTSTPSRHVGLYSFIMDHLNAIRQARVTSESSSSKVTSTSTRKRNQTQADMNDDESTSKKPRK